MIDLEKVKTLLEPATKGYVVLFGEENAISGAVRGTTTEIAGLLLNAAVKSDVFFLAMIAAVEATRRKREKGGAE